SSIPSPALPHDGGGTVGPRLASPLSRGRKGFSCWRRGGHGDAPGAHASRKGPSGELGQAEHHSSGPPADGPPAGGPRPRRWSVQDRLLACLFLLSPIFSQGATNFSRRCLVKSCKSGVRPRAVGLTPAVGTNPPLDLKPHAAYLGYVRRHKSASVKNLSRTRPGPGT